MRGSIDRHDDAASVTLWAILGMGVIAAYARRRSIRNGGEANPPGWLRGVVVASSLIGPWCDRAALTGAA